MRPARLTSALLSILLLSVVPGCPSRERGDDDDGGGEGEGDGGPEPCPDGDLCCPGTPCPFAGYLCTEQNTCVVDPCGVGECCDARPCEGAGLDCVDGACVPRGTLGEPCTADGDCTGPDAQCLFAAEGWPDGYCIQSCVNGDCPGDGLCVGASCFDGCSAIGDCRLGYDCVVVAGGMSCSPE